MRPWAEAIGNAIVDKLVKHYPPAFVADIIDAARRRCAGGK
jgi:hypothetical protein